MIARGPGFVVLFAACLLMGASEATAFDYAEWHFKPVKACEAIDPSESQSGLIFNPDGLRSYYVRSKCFQEAAVDYRDPALRAQVRQRRSLFSSSWGYAPARCRQLVAEGTARDRAELLSFTDTYAHGYTLTFEIVPDTAQPRCCTRPAITWMPRAT
jgi:hypothetical protein